MRTGRGDTVYDRLKRTGYMMGPEHRMGPAFDDQARGPDLTIIIGSPKGNAEGGQRPPGLRDAGNTMESCSECARFEGEDGSGRGKCGKFGADVSRNQVCDEYENAGMPEPEGEPVETAA